MFAKYLLILLTIFVTSNSNLNSSTTATAVITYTIGSIDAITVSGNPGPLNVTSAVAGSNPAAAIDSSTTYAVTTNNTGMRITGTLASNMPAGVTLTIALVAPTGATSAGPVTMDTSTANLVTGVSNAAQGGLTITYILNAEASAAQVTGATNTVTYTISP